MKKMLILFLSVWLLAGCNTVKGFGRDVEKVGGSIENAADK